MIRAFFLSRAASIYDGSFKTDSADSTDQKRIVSELESMQANRHSASRVFDVNNRRTVTLVMDSSCTPVGLNPLNPFNPF
jgi:hypothetical protein